MNLANQKSRFLFTTHLTLVAVFAIIFFGLTVTPANAAIAEWHIKDDVTGGNCSLIGDWDTASKTCSLTQDLSQGIIIDSDYITIDGREHTIIGTGAGYYRYNGVYLSARTGVTIKNLNVTKFTFGIHLSDSSNNTLIGNTVYGNGSGIRLIRASSAWHSSNNTLTNNMASNNSYGIEINSSGDSTFRDNIVRNNSYGIYLSSSARNTFTNNTISNNSYGIYSQYPSNIQTFYNNNFLNNTVQVQVSGSGNVFNLAAPTGGNYWSNFDEPLEGCSNLNNDNFCDLPYAFTGGQDNLPWTKKDGWIAPSNHPPTLSFSETFPDGLSENDGVQDNKGTANKTLFTFDVIYTDQDNNAPSPIKLVVQKVNQGGFEDYFDSEMAPFSPQTDYANGKIYTLERMFPKGNYRYAFKATDGTLDVHTPFTEFTAGYSNVAFLPGLEASRLYRPGIIFENQLWEPNRNKDVEKLYLSPTTGESLNSDIYTRDVIDEANIIPDPTGILDANIYKSFIGAMNTMKSGGVIKDWEALPYDWRLDLKDILAGGKKNGDNVSYLEATSTPFILQELRRLAETSDTGRVIIITHSNGGLLAKYLLKKLEGENGQLLRKVEKLIMVAAPQVGTPAAIEGLLHGDESQLGAGDFGFLLDEERARELAENMQSAYNLLPSQKYFESVQSPVLEFDNSVSRIFELANRSGTQVTTFESMRRFLEGDGTRTEPDRNDEEYPNVLKPHFIANAVNNHDAILDTLRPTTELIQIGGWGIKTIRGIKYSCGLRTCSSLSTLDREPLRTHEGDGTVVIPSAVAMTTNPITKTYYINIREYNSILKINRDHSSILEVDSLLSFIKSLIQEDETLTDNISTTIPPIGNLTALDYITHSPVDIHLYDAEGNHTGLILNPLLDSDVRAYEARIPNSYYREYGEVKYAGSDTFATTTVVLSGKALGTFTFEIKETRGDEIINTLSFIDIPVASSTKATLAIQNIQTASALQLDVEGDGVVDFSLTLSQEANPIISLSIFERVVRTLGFEKGTTQSIIARIGAAKESLERGNKEAARGQLNALVLYLLAQTGKKLDAATAETLIEIIRRIQINVVQ